jgi:hypothetical protein
MRHGCLALAFLIMTSRPVAAAAGAGGTVTGHVIDETGGVLPGVTVHLHTSTAERSTFTNTAGMYRFEDVPAGRAGLTFKLLNFADVDRALTIGDGRIVAADAVMRLALSADVVVTGRATFRNVADMEQPSEDLIAVAASASQGAVTAGQVATRPVMRAGDVLESVPGMVVTQHSGAGKANQYYLRGFNLDHGTDFRRRWPACLSTCRPARTRTATPTRTSSSLN